MQHPYARTPSSGGTEQASLPVALPTAAADLTHSTLTRHPPSSCAGQLHFTKKGSAGAPEGRLEAQVDGPVSPLLLFAGC